LLGGSYSARRRTSVAIGWREAHKTAMPFGLSVVLALAAQAAASFPQASPAPEPAPTVSKRPASGADDACAPAHPDASTREIVICAQRPQGYRLNPDVMEARREMRSGGRPRPPESRTRDNSCATVGPAGCIAAAAGINLLGAAATLGTMATRLSKGEEIGSMFRTTPEPTEYQLYLWAKQRREAREAEKATAAKAKAAQALKEPKPEGKP
jgi:hypothetical protein